MAGAAAAKVGEVVGISLFVMADAIFMICNGRRSKSKRSGWFFTICNRLTMSKDGRQSWCFFSSSLCTCTLVGHLAGRLMGW